MTEIRTKIILLNGASNSGKYTIAKELQELMDEPFLHIGVEEFTKMMPSKYIDEHDKSREGFYLKKIKTANAQDTYLTCAGRYGKKVIMGMIYSCLALAQKGINLIIDDVCYSKDQFQVYKNLFGKYKLFTVGVICPLEELQKREKNMWITKKKIADQESKFVHIDVKYDFEVDTSKELPIECAKKIKRAFYGKKRNKLIV